MTILVKLHYLAVPEDADARVELFGQTSRRSKVSWPASSVASAPGLCRAAASAALGSTASRETVPPASRSAFPDPRPKTIRPSGAAHPVLPVHGPAGPGPDPPHPQLLLQLAGGGAGIVPPGWQPPRCRRSRSTSPRSPGGSRRRRPSLPWLLARATRQSEQAVVAALPHHRLRLQPGAGLLRPEGVVGGVHHQPLPSCTGAAKAL